jgi:uncharacterized NAD(P)/FAD-binding protein YdhS
MSVPRAAPGIGPAIGPAIGVVGCGAVGAALLVALRARLAGAGCPPGSVAVIDRRPDFGRGLAYQDDRDSNLLNRTAAAISVDASDLAAFHRWLLDKARSGTLPGRYRAVSLDPDAYLPRSLFGLYVEETVAATVDRLRAMGWRVDRIVDEAVALDAVPGEGEGNGGGGWRLALAGGRALRLDAVVLCTGNAPATNYPELDGHPGYRATPYPVGDLARGVAPDARVAILGSRLSAIDAALALAEDRPRASLAFASRGGLLPMVGAGRGGHVLSPATLAQAERGRRLGPGAIPLRTLTRLLLEEMRRAAGRRVRARDVTGPVDAPVEAFLRNVEEARAGARAWQDALIPLNDHVADLWTGLSAEDRRRLMAGAYSRYMAHRVAIPPENGERVAALIRAGRLRVLRGLGRVVPLGRGFEVATETGAERFDVVVNGTGASVDLAASGGTLYRGLFAAGRAVPDVHGGIRVDPGSNAVLGADGRPSPGLYAIGNLTAGTFLLTSNLVLNARHAAGVAERLARKAARPLAPAWPAAETKENVHVDLRRLRL